MNNFINVVIKVISIEDGIKINNLIKNKQINFDIKKKNNKYHSIILTSNDYLLNINNILLNSYETMIIITNEEYKNMLDLFYNTEFQLVNYNNNYFILEIRPYLKFKTNISNIFKLRDNFLEINKLSNNK